LDNVFVDDVIIGVGLVIFDLLHWLPGTNRKTQFFVCFFEKNKAKIRIFRALGFVAFVTQKLWPKIVWQKSSFCFFC